MVYIPTILISGLINTFLSLLDPSDRVLLDIGRNMDDLSGDEKKFYIDQKSTRECRISEEIDEVYENEREEIIHINKLRGIHRNS